MGRKSLAILLAVTASVLPFSASAQEFITGAMPSPQSEMAATAKLPRARSPILLNKVDLSSMFPPPDSQGGLGSCTGWAIAYGARSYYLAAETKSRPDTPEEIASPAFQYNHTAVKPPEVARTCGGAYYTTALRFMSETGSLSLREWPYTDKICRPNNASASDLAKAAKNRVPGYRKLLPYGGVATSMNPFKEALQAGHPVMVAMVVYRNWYSYRGSHTFSIPAGVEPEGRGYHAMVVVGYDDARGAIRLQNSWGSNWGDDGYMWIDYDTFLRYTKEAYVFTGMQPAIKPLGDMDEFKPEPKPTPSPTPRPSPSPTPTPTPGTLLHKVQTLLKGYPAMEFAVSELDGRVIVNGHGCADAATQVRKQLRQMSDTMIIRLEETPWPACETRGLLQNAIDRGGVDLKVKNLTPDSPNQIRGLDVGAWVEEDVVVTPVFRNGDLLSMEVELEKERPYLQLFYVQADQSAKEVYRGRLPTDSNGDLKFEIGSKKSKVKLQLTPPYGTEAVIALAGSGPLVSKKLSPNAAESDFMDALRGALEGAKNRNAVFAASVVQLQVEDKTARSSNFLITPGEAEAIAPVDPFEVTDDAASSAAPVILNDTGPKIIVSDVHAGATAADEIVLNASFKAPDGLAIETSSVSVKYRSSTGWFDVTDRVRRKSEITSAGIASSPMQLPPGDHTIRITVLDSDGNEGIVDIPVKIAG